MNCLVKKQVLRFIKHVTFDLVQLELQKTHNRSKVSFSGKVICGCCGENYGRHVWHSNSKYRRYIYRCNQKYKGKQKCETPSVSAEEIQEWSVQAINKVITNKEEIIQNMKLLIKMLENTDALTSLWNLRAENYRKKAKFWTYFLVGASIMLALIFSMLVWFLYEFPLDISKKIPFLSQSFFVVAIISFFIYIIRILVKLSMSNNHLAIEYEQKAAMTRFFQALTYDGESINENERLIIINSLFNKVDTGLVKTDGVEMENMLAILAKNLK